MAQYVYGPRGGLGRRRVRAEVGGGMVAAKKRSPRRPELAALTGTRVRDYVDGRAVLEAVGALAVGRRRARCAWPESWMSGTYVSTACSLRRARCNGGPSPETKA
jgi:hypothetical protein